MATRPLNLMRPKERGVIIKVSGNGPVHRRILDMGLVPGSEVEMERVAPFGDPLAIKVKGYRLSLRRDEAANIQVDVRGAVDGAIPLSEAVPGKTFKVTNINGGWGVGWRLQGMGIVPGARIRVVSIQQRGRMAVEVNGGIVSLGQGTAQKVLVAESQ